MTTSPRSELRRHLRQLRQQLSPRQQQLAAEQLASHITRAGLLNHKQHIAFYLANDGEIDPSPLLHQADQQGKHCYLPVLAPEQRLKFARYRPGSPMSLNRFGIPEPQQKQYLDADKLDVVFLPLVGFDRKGARLGMGGGFYDRSFADIYARPEAQRPQLIGLAHSCQEVAELAVESWDIPLAMIVTEKAVIHPGGQ